MDPQSKRNSPPSRGRDWWFSGLLLLHFVLLVVSAAGDAPTRDEANHLSAGLHMWHTGRFDVNLGNPPLVDIVAAAPTAVLDPEFRFSLSGSIVGPPSLNDPPERYLRAIWLGRLACIPLSLIGGLACYCWASELGGRFAGRAALALWCFCPNLLAYGHIVTGDLACTALGVLSCYAVWQWLVEERISGAIIAGVAVGMALLAKMVWLVWFGLLPLMWLVWVVGRKTSWRKLVAGFGQLVVLQAVAVLFLNLGYAFEETWRPFPTQRFGAGPGREFRPPEFLEKVPIPLPANYLRGFRDAHAVMVGDNTSFLRGEWRSRGWWHYYLYGMAVKVPLGTLALLAVALWVLPHTGMPWRDSLVVLLPAGVLAVVISSLDGLNHHFRYFLPVFPFLFVWLGTAGQWVHEQTRWGTWIVVGCLSATAASTLSQFPHTLSYFNELAGGPARGHRHLVDSSIDWGQDLYRLKRRLERHPRADPPAVVYFGSLAPQLVGVEFRLPPPAPTVGRASPEDGPLESWRPASGWYAVSANLVCGKPSTVVTEEGTSGWHPQDQFAFFQVLKPAAVVGRSIWIFHVTDEQAEELAHRFGWAATREVREDEP